MPEPFQHEEDTSTAMRKPVTYVNPFTSRHLRPGVIDFIFPCDMTHPELLAKLRRLKGYCQIIGPHGTGKSTLLANITNSMISSGETIHSFRLTSQSRRSTFGLLQVLGWKKDSQVIIDGFEQLSTWQRWIVRTLLRWRKVGLLVTTHWDAGLPTLYDTSSSTRVATQVVEQIAINAQLDHSPVSAATVKQAVQESGGNLREALFSLYDQCEQSWYGR